MTGARHNGFTLAEVLVACFLGFTWILPTTR